MIVRIFGTGHGRTGITPSKDDCFIYVRTEDYSTTGYNLSPKGIFLLDVASKSTQDFRAFVELKEDLRAVSTKRKGQSQSTPLIDKPEFVLISHSHGDHCAGAGELAHTYTVPPGAHFYGTTGNPKTNSKDIRQIIFNQLNGQNSVGIPPKIWVHELMHDGGDISELMCPDGASYKIGQERKTLLPYNHTTGIITLIQDGSFQVDARYGNQHSNSEENVLAYSITEKSHLVNLIAQSEETPIKLIKRLFAKAHKKSADDIRDFQDLEGKLLELFEKLDTDNKDIPKGYDILTFKKDLARVEFVYTQTKLTYITDTPIKDEVDIHNFSQLAKNSDLLICGTPVFKGPHAHHLTTEQAAEIAIRSGSKTLLITHLNTQHQNFNMGRECEDYVGKMHTEADIQHRLAENGIRYVKALPIELEPIRGNINVYKA